MSTQGTANNSPLLSPSQSGIAEANQNGDVSMNDQEGESSESLETDVDAEEEGDEENDVGGASVGTHDPVRGIQDEDNEKGESGLQEWIHPVRAGWIKKDGKYPENETFFPLPIVTFMVDVPDDISCRICRVSVLSVNPNDPSVTDETPAIMPCGHVAGAECLAALMESMDPGTWNCPFCRTPLIHLGCGHRVREKVLTWHTLVNLPKTVPMGGVVPQFCQECRARESTMGWSIVIADTRREVTRARDIYFNVEQSEANSRLLMRKVRELEAMVRYAGESISGLKSW